MINNTLTATTNTFPNLLLQFLIILSFMFKQLTLTTTWILTVGLFTIKTMVNILRNLTIGLPIKLSREHYNYIFKFLFYSLRGSHCLNDLSFEIYFWVFQEVLNNIEVLNLFWFYLDYFMFKRLMKISFKTGVKVFRTFSTTQRVPRDFVSYFKLK